MAVYVDDAAHEFNGMRLCHMVADTPEELRAMAARIGVALRWIQAPGTWREHFDIAQTKRRLALRAGAVEVTQRELAAIRRRKRQ